MGPYRDSNPLRLTVLAAMSEDYTTAPQHIELGWESLSSRRWSRRLTLFYKIMNNLTPLYAKEPIPQPHQSNYCLRNQGVVWRMRARTEQFQSGFYHPNCISEWNKLDPEIRLAPSVAVFKIKLLSIICPPAKSVFGIHDPIGLPDHWMIYFWTMGMLSITYQIKYVNSVKPSVYQI